MVGLFLEWLLLHIIIRENHGLVPRGPPSRGVKVGTPLLRGGRWDIARVPRGSQKEVLCQRGSSWGRDNPRLGRLGLSDDNPPGGPSYDGPLLFPFALQFEQAQHAWHVVHQLVRTGGVNGKIGLCNQKTMSISISTGAINTR